MADNGTWDVQDGFGPEQEVPYQGGDDDGWGDFGGGWDAPSEDSSQGGESGFDSGFGSDGGQGGFIQQDDDGWGRTSGVEEAPVPDAPNPNDFASSEAHIQEFQPRQFNLSMKKVAVIIAVAGVLVALLFLGLDKIHFKPKQPSSNPPVQTQQPVQDTNQGGSEANKPTDTNTDVDSVTLVEIPESMKLDYNGDVLEMNAKVINKLKYVQGHQVLYCVNLGVAMGASSETVSYYCNLSSFNAVSVGDIVIIKYQQVNDSYISIMSISK